MNAASHAEHHRLDALVDVVLAQARADGALLDRRQRRSQSAGAQQQSQFAAFDRIDAGDLEIIAEYAADGGAVDDLFGGLVDFDALRVLLPRAVDEHHGHQVAEIFLGILQHFRGAAAVKAHRHGRTVLGIRLERGVGELVAGHHHVALQQHRLLFARVEQLRSQGHASGAGRLERIVGLIDHAEFQGRRLAEDFLHLRRILQSRQLDGDAIHALAGHLRFGYRQFRAVETIAQNDDVLLNRVGLAFLDLLRRQLQFQRRRARDRDVGQLQVAAVGENRRFALGEAVGVAKQHANPIVRVVHDHVLVGDARVAQRGAKILLVPVEQLFHRALHVHLVDEVDAAAKIQPEFHGLESEPMHPGGTREACDSAIVN